jgi:outer membrane protein OmpA-like peptidoglycan-associated protein
MTIVTAVVGEEGDYESIKRITSTSHDSILIHYSAEQPDPWAKNRRLEKASQSPTAAASQLPPPPDTIEGDRLVAVKDLQQSHQYNETFHMTGPRPDDFPKTTALGVSSEVLAELKKDGASPFAYEPGFIVFMKKYYSTTTPSKDKPNPVQIPEGKKATLVGPQDIREYCSLERVGKSDYAYPVLLNDEPATLPSVRAKCAAEGGDAEFYILDDPDNPLALAWKISSGEILQVTKISYPAANSSSPIEKQLEQNGKVDIYSIYFNFDSAHLRPESDPTLAEIARILQSHSSWKLNVGGHTDNIGGDNYNLELSKKRAEAVKEALVTRYHIAAGKLDTQGFGAAGPIDNNKTVEGRARNRRVELVRQ